MNDVLDAPACNQAGAVVLRRRLTVHVLCWLLLQFGRLERVEVGGTKGKALTNAIKQVHADFLAAHGKFQEVS
jgi:hypothetical protein